MNQQSTNQQYQQSTITINQAFELLSECLETEAELQILLGLLPESKGGAGLLALGLLSKSSRYVRSFDHIASHHVTLFHITPNHTRNSTRATRWDTYDHELVRAANRRSGEV